MFPPDIASLFLGDDEENGPEKMKALAQALGGQKQLGLLGQLTGDKVLSGVGNSLLQGAGRQEGLVAQYGERRQQGALSRALDALKAKREGEINARELAEKQAGELRAHTYQEGRDSRQNAAAMQRARVMAGIAAGAKDVAAERGTVIPGLEKEAGAAPTADDAKKVKASLVSAAKLKKLGAEMRALHAEHGTELSGPIATRMEQIQTAMKLEGKNIGELGALSGPDEALMNALIGTDTTSLKANAKALFGFDNTQTALDGLDSWADGALESTKKTYGYRDAAAPGALSPTQQKRLAELRAKRGAK